MKKFFYKSFKIKRYFIAIYSFKTKDGRQYTGRIGIISYNGSYLSSKQFPKIVCLKNENVDIDENSILILNIIELNESDYNDFLDIEYA